MGLMCVWLNVGGPVCVLMVCGGLWYSVYFDVHRNAEGFPLRLKGRSLHPIARTPTSSSGRHGGSSVELTSPLRPRGRACSASVWGNLPLPVTWATPTYEVVAMPARPPAEPVPSKIPPSLHPRLPLLRFDVRYMFCFSPVDSGERLARIAQTLLWCIAPPKFSPRACLCWI